MTILCNCINRNTNTNIQTHTHTHTHTSDHIISYHIISDHIISYHIYTYIYIYTWVLTRSSGLPFNGIFPIVGLV